ncbi:thiolase family protein [Microlunatus elymi]|uniref:Thiolase family protein n=1 Tax=Microlunatus elymi TaxID=2596828 RepID=A0A516PUQ8_9ACTN|nr:thiolase family protein [Microlunatus elymi]QDP94917.1 thiolase family protein [Microlunatus elymi]
MRTAVIVDVLRTPTGKGKPGGALSDIHPADLLARVIRGLVERTGIDPELIEDVLCGCVSQGGEQAMNIGRTAALAAGLPESVPGTTIDRQCGSSQQAAHFAAQGVIAGAYDVVLACGVESMSRVPMFSTFAGKNPYEPLQSRYPDGLVQQGISAELISAHWKLDRPTLDAFAAESHRRAAQATQDGTFADEIIAIDDHETDETIRPGTTAEGLAQLKPAFYDPAIGERFDEIDWTITAGNSSPLTDGAAAVLIMSEERAAQLGLTPRARFVSFAVTGSDPLLMLTGIIPATRKLLERSGLSIDDLDAYEVNEAFAPVPLAWQREFNADPQKLNPRGGAIALGHPLGATGAKLLTSLVSYLDRTGGRYGLQTMCEGGGMANAMIIERLD